MLVHNLQADKSGVFDSRQNIRACHPPTPRLSCNEKFDWNDRRVFPRDKSFGCRLNSSVVRVRENGVYVTPPPFVTAEDAGSHFRWKVVRQHVNRLMVIDVAREDEFNDRRFFLLNLTIPRFVEEITELHRLIPISEVAAGQCPDNRQVHHKKKAIIASASLNVFLPT